MNWLNWGIDKVLENVDKNEKEEKEEKGGEDERKSWRSDQLKIVIVGPPGSGKEVQGRTIANKYELQFSGYRQCIVHHLTKKTELGEEYRPFYTQKKAVPGELMNKMFREVIDNDKGFVIKGYPITENQADRFIEEFQPDLCLFVRIPEELARERLNYRRIDPETRDVYNLKSDPPPDQVSPRIRRMKSDSPVNIGKRLTMYKASNFEGTVVRKFSYIIEVDGRKKKKEVNEAITREIDNFIQMKMTPSTDEEEEDFDDDSDGEVKNNRIEPESVSESVVPCHQPTRLKEEDVNLLEIIVNLQKQHKKMEKKIESLQIEVKEMKQKCERIPILEKKIQVLKEDTEGRDEDIEQFVNDLTSQLEKFQKRVKRKRRNLEY